MARPLTIFFAVIFTMVVAIGYVPRFITTEGDVRMLFGLFELSLLDDITHGVSALAAFAAGLTSRRASMLFLTAFGYYYGLDAVFFLTNGFFNNLAWIQDILLNLPHVLIAVVMLGYVHRLAPREAAAS